MDFLRREHDRIKFKSKLIVKTDADKVHLGECVNLSMGGMRLSVFKETEQFKHGSLSLSCEYQGEIVGLETSFTLQWRKPSEKHVDHDELGVMFTSLSDKARINLVQILVCQMREEPVEAEWL